GLVFFGFPLHPAGKPAAERGEHLLQVQCPMLFLQGTKDELADETLLRALVGRLGQIATLELVADADHSFHVPVRSGRRDAEVLAGLLDSVARWTATRAAAPAAP
ncbi:MAG TPA: alpha/beta family hydrolase, partial [Burkholderiaceae bacterium]|nr:alpha/beta family hydrolase [Burkholderiaceae bacterium]